MDPMPAEFAEEVKPEPSEAEAPEVAAEVADSEPADKKDDVETPPAGDDTQPETPEKKESRVQKRIDKLTQEKYDAQRERDYYKGLAEGRQVNTEQSTETQSIPGLRPKPTLEQFDFDQEAHTEAMADWVIDKRELLTKQASASTRQSELVANHNKRIDTAATMYPDFDDVVEASADLPVTQAMHETILQSEFSADIVYYLAKHPEETKKIAALPPVRQIAELGKIETKFEKKPEPPPPKRITQAPEPIKPVSGQEIETETVVDDNDWYRKEQARLRKLGRLY